MKKILVTGGLGYIGSHVVVELQNSNYGLISSNQLNDAITNGLSNQRHLIRHNSGTILSVETDYINVNSSGNVVIEAIGRPIITFISN